MALSLNPEAASPGIEKVNTFHWIVFVVIVIAVLRYQRGHPAGDEAPAPPRPDGWRNRWTTAAGRTRPRRRRAGPFRHRHGLLQPGPGDTDRQQRGCRTERATTSLEIRVTGQQWLWRYDYPNGAFSFHRLVVPSDTTVALELVSADVVHGWNVPSLTGKAQAVPGKTNTVYFRADQEGTFSGRASVLSGQGYDSMEAEVDVVSPAEYETFIRERKADIQRAQNSVVRTQEEQLKAAAEETPGGEVEPTP